MTDISTYDVIVVKFPFASSLKYKARPAVVVSSTDYNHTGRKTLLIVAISSNIRGKLEIEDEIEYWKEVGLLKPSIFKAAVATIEREYVLAHIGHLTVKDKHKLDKMIDKMCL